MTTAGWWVTAAAALLAAHRAGIVDRGADLAVRATGRLNRRAGGDLAVIVMVVAAPIAAAAAAARQPLVAAAATLVTVFAGDVRARQTADRLAEIERALRQRATDARDLEAVQRATVAQVLAQLDWLNDNEPL